MRSKLLIALFLLSSSWLAFGEVVYEEDYSSETDLGRELPLPPRPLEPAPGGGLSEFPQEEQGEVWDEEVPIEDEAGPVDGEGDDYVE